MDASDTRYPALQALTAYWLQHPHASDTLEGICQWWLNAALFPAPRVEAALWWLVEHGTVQAQRAADGRVHYRLSGEPASPPS